MLWFFIFGFFLSFLYLQKMGVLLLVILLLLFLLFMGFFLLRGFPTTPFDSPEFTPVNLRGHKGVLLKSGSIHLDDQTQILNTSMPSSSSPSSSLSFDYDVFLSFRGEDTRKTFVDHLYKALEDRLIHTYKDDITLPRGESVGPALLEAIKESRYAVIIFSKNYADSSWCLDELVHIMKCRTVYGQTVLPIFYDVDPSDVRKQKGEFGKAFAKQKAENIAQARIWRKTLVAASNISGWEPKNVANGHESVVIKKIVDTIFDGLFPLNSDIDAELVGMRARLQDIISRLEIGSGGVRMVGIWGVGGGGKTTLATSVYMEILGHFKSHCILENIREESHESGLKKLQGDILSAASKTKMEVPSVVEGKHKIKSMLQHRKVLVILDNVDDLGQLEALAGSHSWFGDGSRIIITTRDEHLLRRHKVDHVSPVRLLSHDEAIWLLNSHAYNAEKHLKDYEKLSLQVVSYASGLPLALRVLGSFLYDKDEKEWISTLDRLKHIPEREIVMKLKISYDGLKSVEKELFLDIACFFRGKSKDGAMEILDACDFFPDIGIRVLIQKALITVNSDGRFDMHDLIQEMGHYIVRGEHPNNPEKHSRVWKREEINNMCLGDTTMENFETQVIHQYYIDHPLRYFKIVSNMKKLRWLRVDKPCSEAPSSLSNELRYIKWKGYPASPFPDIFQPTNLVVLKIEHSFQKELWKGYKYLSLLKVLQLNESNLVSTPDFDGLPSLQKLELCKCTKLEMIHSSLGNHRSLKFVNVSSCYSLKKFPVIINMKKLENLYIKYCHKVFEFPEIQSNLESLLTLSLCSIGIQVLLPSIAVHCPNLISLCVSCLSYCTIRTEVSFNQLRHLTYSLRKLTLYGCFLKDGEIPSDIGELSNLQELDLSSNNFTKLDFSLSQLTRLKIFNLSHCKRLVELPELPSNIAILKADFCYSLTSVGNFHTNCEWLCQVSVMNGSIIIDGDRLLQSMLEGKAIENHSMVLLLEGLQIPRMFRPRLHDGTKCTLQLPENWRNDFCGFLMCIVIKDDSITLSIPKITMKQVRGGSMVGMDSQDDVVWNESVDDKRTWVCYVSFGSFRHTEWLDETYKAVSFSICTPLLKYTYVRNPFGGFGVSLVPRTSGSGPTDTSLPEYYSVFYQKKYDFKPNFKINNDLTCNFQIPYYSLPQTIISSD